MTCLAGCSSDSTAYVIVRYLPSPVVGEKIKDCNIAFDKQNGISYYTEWMVWDNEAEDYAPCNEYDTFVGGTDYKLCARIVPDKNVVMVKDLDVQLPEGCKIHNSWEDEEQLFLDFGLIDVTTETHEIDKITLTGLPEPVAGALIPDNLTLSEDIPDCNIQLYWINELGEVTFTQSLRSGDYYSAQVIITLPPTYKITDDFVIVLDGETYERGEYLIHSSDIYLEIEYVIP